MKAYGLDVHCALRTHRAHDLVHLGLGPQRLIVFWKSKTKGGDVYVAYRACCTAHPRGMGTR